MGTCVVCVVLRGPHGLGPANWSVLGCNPSGAEWLLLASSLLALLGTVVVAV